MNTIEQKTEQEWLKQLRMTYYVIYALTIALFGVVWYINYTSVAETGEAYKLIDPNEPMGLGLQYGVILYTLAAIPGALYWFKHKCRTIAKIEDEATRLDQYYRHAHMRMSVIALSMPVGIMVYMLLGAYRPMIWVAAIAAVAFVFTKPSEAKTREELAPSANETY